ncbi:MAG: metallophosphoesterase family protein [Clostridiales bacterium]|nr:metallophosphoesterase family protein [Clostridiales bacterium]
MPDHLFVSICGDAKTSMAVTWRTSQDVDSGYVLFRPEWENPGREKKCAAVSRPIKSDIDESVMHTAILSGLSPGTKYFYTAGNDIFRSEEFAFSTEPEYLPYYSFIVIADEQNEEPFLTPNYAPVRRMLERALEKCPEAKFILTLGDNVSDGQNELQWNGLFHGLRGICEKLPLMMLTGNHDNRGYRKYDETGKDGKFYLDHADFFDEQFALSYPRNGFKGFETENFSFDYGSVHFTMMGINSYAELGKWAADDINTSGAAWKIAAFHFPFFPVMSEGVGALCWDELCKPFWEAKPDLLLMGHEHSYARSYPLDRLEAKNRPSEGTVHCILGNSGENCFSSNAPKLRYSFFHPQEEKTCMYALVHVSPERLTVEVMLDDGRGVDTFSIDKERDLIVPPVVPPVYMRTRIAWKGAIVEMAARDLACYARGDDFLIPFASVVQCIGAFAEKEPGLLRIRLFGHTAEFREGQTEATADGKPFRLRLAPERLDKGQLFVSVSDAADIFGLRWGYAAHNNIVDLDYPSEEYPLTPQP